MPATKKKELRNERNKQKEWQGLFSEVLFLNGCAVKVVVCELNNHYYSCLIMPISIYLYHPNSSDGHKCISLPIILIYTKFL